MKAAQAKPLEVNPRPFGAQLFAAEYFAEEVRRELIEMYGKDKLDKGGLSVRTTLDPKLQIYARQALARGLIAFDRKRGFRGPVSKVEIAAATGACCSIEPQGSRRCCALAAGGGARGERAARRAIGLQPSCSPTASWTRSARPAPSRSSLMGWARAYVDGTKLGPEIEEGFRGAGCRRRRLCRAVSSEEGQMASGADARRRRRPGRHGSRTRAACWRWSAASPMAAASSTAPSRPCASPARPSSRSSMRRRSTTATRRPPWCSTRRSSINMPNGEVWKPEELPEQVLRPLDAAPRHRAVAQRDDRAPGPGPRHDHDRRPCRSASASTTSCRCSWPWRWAPAKPR